MLACDRLVSLVVDVVSHYIHAHMSQHSKFYSSCPSRRESGEVLSPRARRAPTVAREPPCRKTEIAYRMEYGCLITHDIFLYHYGAVRRHTMLPHVVLSSDGRGFVDRVLRWLRVGEASPRHSCRRSPVLPLGRPPPRLMMCRTARLPLAAVDILSQAEQNRAHEHAPDDGDHDGARDEAADEDLATAPRVGLRQEACARPRQHRTPNSEAWLRQGEDLRQVFARPQLDGLALLVLGAKLEFEARIDEDGGCKKRCRTRSGRVLVDSRPLGQTQVASPSHKQEGSRATRH